MNKQIIIALCCAFLINKSSYSASVAAVPYSSVIVVGNNLTFIGNAHIEDITRELVFAEINNAVSLLQDQLGAADTSLNSDTLRFMKETFKRNSVHLFKKEYVNRHNLIENVVAIYDRLIPIIVESKPLGFKESCSKIAAIEALKQFSEPYRDALIRQ